MISNNIIQVRNDLIWSPSQSTAKVSLKTQDRIQLHVSFLLTYFILNKLDGIFFFFYYELLNFFFIFFPLCFLSSHSEISPYYTTYLHVAWL